MEDDQAVLPLIYFVPDSKQDAFCGGSKKLYPVRKSTARMRPIDFAILLLLVACGLWTVGKLER